MTDIATPVEDIDDLDIETPTVRNSYKFRITPSVTRIFPDFAFGQDAEDAIAKARLQYSIPLDEGVTAERISDLTHMKFRIN